MTTPLLLFVSLYSSIYLVEGIILYLYFSKLFTPNKSKKQLYLTYIFFYTVLFGISFFEIVKINILSFTIVNFIILVCLYNTRLGISLIHTLVITCINMFSEIAVMGLSQQYSIEVRSNVFFMVILTITSKIIYFLVLMIIANIFNMCNKSTQEPEKYIRKNSFATNITNILILLIPLMSIYISSSIFDILLIDSIDKSSRYLLSSCAFVIILINIFIFFIYYYVLHKNNEVNKLNVQHQKETDMAQYYKELFIQNENQRILIHDIRNHLSSLMELNKINDSVQIHQYLEKLLNSPELQKNIRVSDNEMLNSIICHYIKICNDKGISLKTDIRKNVVKYMDYTELTALFCNLLDNSVEACTNIADSYIELNVSEQENSVFTLISVRNTCVTKPKFNKQNIPVTTKKETIFHGIGLKSIQRIVKKYDGEMTMLYDDEYNEFQTIIYLKDPTSPFLLQNK